MVFRGTQSVSFNLITSNTNYTLVGWINTAITNQAHLFRGSGSNDTYQIHSGRIWWYIGGDRYSTTYINDNQTYMIAYQRSGTTYSIWVNGIQENSWDFYTNTNHETFYLQGIGSHISSRPYNGLVNEVSAWNTALSTSEMQELFNDGVYDATTHSKSANLIGYWKTMVYYMER